MSKKVTTEIFIKKAKEIYGNKYNYSLVDYINAKTKVKIICPIHGVFEQTPDSFLRGHCCQLCGFESMKALKTKSTENFILESKQIHKTKYNYSKVIYKGALKKVKIICPEHGVFEQTPHDHLGGHGCPSCKESKGEKKIEDFLLKNNISFESQKKFNDLKDKRKLSYDFYIPFKNLLIEYNGRQHYAQQNFFQNREDFLAQKHHDWLKRKYAKNNKINLLTIPYWDFENIETILETTIYKN